MEPDRTWTIARVMALMAAASTCLATVTVWAMVLTPGVKCLWGGLLLPCTMLALIAEGSKFLFLDIALCRSAIWFPSGVDSLPAAAETCELGQTAYYSIAAGALHLVSLFAVCLHAPEKRELDPDFGVEYRTGAELDLEVGGKEEQTKNIDACCTGSSKSQRSTQAFEAVIEEDSVLEDDLYTESSSEPAGSTTTATTEERSQQQATASIPMSPVKEEDLTTTVTPPQPVLQTENVSESRLSTLSKVERNAASPPRKEELVQQLVSELDSVFDGKDK